MTTEEIKARVERLKQVFRLAGQELYDLNSEAEAAGEAWQLEAFHPLLQEIESYISTPDYSSPGYDE